MARFSLPLFATPSFILFVTVASGAPIDFATQVVPILEQNCLSCHSGDDPDGSFDLTTLEKATTTGDEGSALVAGQPDESLLFQLMTADEDDDRLMPPANAEGPLDRRQIETIRLWIEQGATWPTAIRLTPKERKPRSVGDSPDNRELIEKIHALIVAKQEAEPEEMNDYSAEVPSTNAPYHMVAVAGGEFMMGSPDAEADRTDEEGPATRVEVAPFWIGKYEVTWDEYEPFMMTQVDRRKDGSRTDYDPTTHTIVDAVSQPTKPYMEMSFGMGQKGFPAISMTQHAANKYCQWLSAQTGHFYRLPTEAEWEYACRAGTTTAYSFGDDPSRIGEFAWYYENSNEKYQKVGRKKPNPWGIHDMHGNVMEWTVDQYASDYFSRISDQLTNPLIRPDRLYPRAVRGGGWDDDADRLRSAARRGSDAAWKQQDPQLPKSIWYHTDARWLGFRIVRPRSVPTVDEMDFFWNSAANKR